MPSQTFLIEKGRTELFEFICGENNCDPFDVFEKDSNFNYVSVHYCNVKDIFLLGFNFGAYSTIFIQN